MNKTVIIAKLFHESNGFNPRITKESDFEILYGSDVLTNARSSGTTLGGIVRTFEAAGGVELIPVISVNGSPSGLVDHRFFLKVQDSLLSKVAEHRPDAIALELHGSMATDKCFDVEGELLGKLRQASGANAIIGAGLDLHAHITPKMLENSDICIACKQNPHADVVECGERTASLMLEVMHGKLEPVYVMGKTRQILPGKMDTNSGPLAHLLARSQELSALHPEVRDISLYNVFRFLDAEDIGSAAAVLTNNAPEIAEPIVQEFIEAFWDRRDEFWDDLMTIEQSLDRIAAARQENGLPFIIADMGDRTLAGAPGDSNTILAALLRRELPLRGAIPVTDPESVSQAIAAGPGKSLQLQIGGKQTPGFKPLPVKATVVAVSDGAYTVKGPYQAGERVSLGAAATVKMDGGTTVLLHSKPGFTHDPNAFESQGIRVSEQDFVVVKSGYHFSMNFKGLGTPLYVATPGISYYTPGGMPRHVGRVWPEHDVSGSPFIAPRIFRPRRRSGEQTR